MLNKLTVLVLAFGFSCSMQAQELSEKSSIQDAVDHFVSAQLSSKKIQPANQLKDNLLLRRTMLDLVGRIPTAAEVEAYVADNDPAKREKLVDHLLQQDEFYEQFAYDLNNILMPAGKSDLESYLLDALKNQKGWDKMFAEMINGNNQEPMSKQAMQFVRQRVSDLDNLTNSTSALFFGVNISCAKCHDHPLVAEWTQSHFYGMKSFFNRTFTNGDFVAERAYGDVKFTTTEGIKKDAQLMFLTGTTIKEPAPIKQNDAARKKEKAELEKLKKEKKPVPPPKFSRRAQLIKLALSTKERDYFAKNMVNRIWFRIIGHGLVMPLDQMHPENPASHPELLNWLARDAVNNGYDMKRLIRGLVLSRMYSQSSRYEGSKRPERSTFGVANLKPLSPRQYAASLAIAARNPSHWEDPANSSKLIKDEVKSNRGWANKFVVPGDEFQVSVDEALLLSNDSAFEDKTKVSSNRLAGEMAKMGTADQMTELAFKAIYSRSPTSEELKSVSSYLSARKDRREEAISQIVWALLTSSELRFNH